MSVPLTPVIMVGSVLMASTSILANADLDILDTIVTKANIF